VQNYELIGSVVAAYLQNRFDPEEEGTARYLIDCLTAEQTAAIAKAILSDDTLADLIEVKLPDHFVGNFGLPPENLTTERTTYFRHADCNKSALLVANTGDDEEQSLKELVPIGRDQLFEQTDLWVQVISSGLPISPDHLNWWNKALQGLLEVRSFTLEMFAEYILETKAAIDDGPPILHALGVSLPALRIPRDARYFNSLTEKNARHKSRWKNQYSHAIKKRACYLLKQTPTQNLLTNNELLNSFGRVKDSIPSELHSTIFEFIYASSGWNVEAYNLAKCEWELIKPIFDGLKPPKFNLGQATLDFYDEREAELLTDDERDYLNHLVKRKTTEAQDEDGEFYNNHRLELKESQSLKSKWDHFIFGSPIESGDFIVGFALCLEALFDNNLSNTKRKLTIRCDRRTKRDLKALNVDAGLFFSSRYSGIIGLFGRNVGWDVGSLFNFAKLDKEWRSASKSYVNRSISKTALRLKFFLELEVEYENGNIETYSKQLIWIFNPTAVISEFSGDWSRLMEHPLVICRANRELVSEKGHFQPLDLGDVRTLLPTYDRDRGSFVAVYKKENDISLIWNQNLNSSIEQSLISKDTAERIRNLFVTFQTNYIDSIKGFVEDGLLNENLIKQAESYSDLLLTICKEAKGDGNRALLLQPLLQIGTVIVEGGRATSIVAPWNPLRLVAIAYKARQISSLLKHLLVSKEIFFGDPRLFFKELKEELEHPYYPEIVLGWDQNRPELLSLTDYYLDYSLHESPIASNNGSDHTNENPNVSSSLILDIVKRFLYLYPHEKANLSLALYNSDSARLPQAIVNKISELHDEEEDMRCEIILRHRDNKKLNALYAEIIESLDNDPDSLVASEVTKDFMARLRIGIMADQAPIPDPKDGPPIDLVFLQDVIARRARVEWYHVSAQPIDAALFVPVRWSRRRPAAMDDMKSVAYLCCPVQSKEGWSFIIALTSFLKGDWDGNEEELLLPARQLDFNDTETATIFKEIHDLGHWVVNYDELLDRRQLLNQNVRVIRYKQLATQGRNLLISSKANLGLLRTMVFSRIKDLNLDLTDDKCRKLTERFIDDAIEISGDIVLRAAKRGRNASELMGIVLSRYMIQRELGTYKYLGWYFLDDYAEWLGQREEQIADILALSPEKDSDGKMRLAVIVSEAKYIDAVNLSKKRKESQKQLRDTMRRISDAIFGDPQRLDRDLWLSRFSDLVLNGIRFPANESLDLSAWRRAIRNGQCEIYLRGYSHVFVSGPTDCPECSDFSKVAELEDSYQEIFSRAKLRELVLKYWKNADPMQMRKEGTDTNIWDSVLYKKLTERVDLTSKDETEMLLKVEKVIIDVNKGQEDLNKQYEKDDKSDIWTYKSIESFIDKHQQAMEDTKAEKEWLKKTINLCKGALQEFQLRSKLISSAITPNAAFLKFEGSANLTVEQVLKRRSEFLTTHKLNIISVRAEPGIVAISIARPSRKILYLLDVWKKWNPKRTSGNHKLLIGLKEEDSHLLFLSPQENAPHTLIAGSTGSGKSVLMQNIILGIACTNTPEQAQITLIDPKHGVDYFAFEGLPHLKEGVIDDQQQAIQVLNELVNEMDRRYAVLKQNKVSNIYDLNKKENKNKHLPLLWIIHDEFAEWMMTKEYGEAVSNIVARLGVKARAAGIFLVFAAQSPDAHVMPMQLRANLGNRLILRVDSEGTSEIALGEKGAERLLGKGHLAAKLEGEDTIITAQVPYVRSEEIENVVSKIVNDNNNSKRS